MGGKPEDGAEPFQNVQPEDQRKKQSTSPARGDQPEPLDEKSLEAVMRECPL